MDLSYGIRGTTSDQTYEAVSRCLALRVPACLRVSVVILSSTTNKGRFWAFLESLATFEPGLVKG